MFFTLAPFETGFLHLCDFCICKQKLGLGLDRLVCMECLRVRHAVFRPEYPFDDMTFDYRKAWTARIERIGISCRLWVSRAESLAETLQLCVWSSSSIGRQKLLVRLSASIYVTLISSVILGGDHQMQPYRRSSGARAALLPSHVWYARDEQIKRHFMPARSRCEQHAWRINSVDIEAADVMKGDVVLLSRHPCGLVAFVLAKHAHPSQDAASKSNECFRIASGCQ